MSAGAPIGKAWVATQTHAQTQASAPAIAAGLGSQLFVQGAVISASDAPAAPVSATITGLESGTLELEIPAAKFAPIVLNFGLTPFRVTPGQQAQLTVPDLGAGIKCTAMLFTTTR